MNNFFQYFNYSSQDLMSYRHFYILGSIYILSKLKKYYPVIKNKFLQSSDSGVLVCEKDYNNNNNNNNWSYFLLSNSDLDKELVYKPTASLKTINYKVKCIFTPLGYLQYIHLKQGNSTVTQIMLSRRNNQLSSNQNPMEMDHLTESHLIPNYNYVLSPLIHQSNDEN